MYHRPCTTILLRYSMGQVTLKRTYSFNSCPYNIHRDVWIFSKKLIRKNLKKTRTNERFLKHKTLSPTRYHIYLTIQRVSTVSDGFVDSTRISFLFYFFFFNFNRPWQQITTRAHTGTYKTIMHVRGWKRVVNIGLSGEPNSSRIYIYIYICTYV